MILFDNRVIYLLILSLPDLKHKQDITFYINSIKEYILSITKNQLGINNKGHKSVRFPILNSNLLLELYNFNIKVNKQL